MPAGDRGPRSYWAPLALAAVGSTHDDILGALNLFTLGTPNSIGGP